MYFFKRAFFLDDGKALNALELFEGSVRKEGERRKLSSLER